MSDFENRNFSNDGYNQGYSYQQPSLEQTSENVIAGLVGAFLFSLAGGLLYFIIFQLGYVAGITGLVIVVLANFGYEKFSGCKASLKGAAISLILLVAVTILAQYFCLAYEIYKVFKEDFMISFTDAFKAVPDFMQEPEVRAEVVKNIIMSLALGLLAAFSTIASSFKGRKNK